MKGGLVTLLSSLPRKEREGKKVKMKMNNFFYLLMKYLLAIEIHCMDPNIIKFPHSHSHSPIQHLKYSKVKQYSLVKIFSAFY